MDVLITGAGSGIGKATAEKLLERGHKVIAFDIDAEALEQLPEEIEIYQGDVYNEERVEQVVEQIDFEVLVNCAGYYEQGSMEDMPLEKVERIFEVNVFGSLNFTRKALPSLRKCNGKIINVSSIAGKVAVPFSGQYCGSKHAVEALSDALRMEVADQGIDVVVVEPGIIETGFNQNARKALEKYMPDSIYSENYQEILENGGLRGVDAEVPANKIVKIVETGNPKSRYQTPGRAKIFVALEKLSPVFLKDYIKKRI